MAIFPTYARILVAGYGEQRDSALLRTEMESGPPKQARVKSRVMVTRQASIYLETTADYEAFKAWYSETIREGADWFSFTDPISKAVRQARFVGGGLDAKPLETNPRGWTINAKIETWG